MSTQGDYGTTDSDVEEYDIHEDDADGVETPAVELDTAAANVWYLWAFATLAVVAAVYFHLTEGLVTTAAEWFYAVIFAGLAVGAVVYGAYEVNERTSSF